MNRQVTYTTFIASACALAGCKSMPNVTVRYYEARSSLDLVVTQTASCAGDIPALTTDVVPTVSYAANRDKAQREVPIGTLGGTFGKGDATFEFYADGRLKSVNSKGTGQAGEVLKALVKFAGVMGMVKTAARPAVDTAQELCKKLNGKPLTIVRRGSTGFDKESGNIEFQPEHADKSLDSIFGTLTGKYQVTAAITTHTATLAKSDVKLPLVEPAVGAVTVSLAGGRGPATWTFTVLVPQRGAPYNLPIQEAPWFGSHEVEVQLHESGKVTKLHYTGSPDAAGMLGTLTDVRGAFDEPTVSTADQAKAVQAEADLIYQQQRLVLCQTNPSSCPK